jgi:mRNA (2'-O-methyladenosine-N6-)-methyltransferase
LVDPPWEEYYKRATVVAKERVPDELIKETQPWSFTELFDLQIENLADTQAFLFLWCGAHENLETGRTLMKKWGFKRCEDIVWLKQNVHNDHAFRNKVSKNIYPESVFVKTKEHCLVGYKG